MIRGHVLPGIFLLALFGTTVCAAQEAAGPAPGPTTTDAQPKVSNTETVVVTAPGEFRVEQEMQAPALIEQAPGTSPIKSISVLPSPHFLSARNPEARALARQNKRENHWIMEPDQ